MPLIVAATFAFSMVVSTLMIAAKVGAAPLGEVMVRFDNITVSANTTGTVCAKPQSTATEVEVAVEFPTGYSVSATPSDHTVNTSNLAWPSGAQAWPGIGTATNVSGQVVTFPSNDLTAGTLYCFNWTNASAIETQSSASSTNVGSVTTYSSGPTIVDSTAYVTQTVNDGTLDVTATVPQTFSFALSGNTDNLGSLSTSSVTTSSSPQTITVNTNAQFGWVVWAREDSNAGLYSTSANHSIDSSPAGQATALSAGTEGYITGISSGQDSGSGTITVVSAYNYNGGVGNTGAALDNTLRMIASSNGTAANAVLTIRNQVAISGTTPAATDYADTITFTGAGIF